MSVYVDLECDRCGLTLIDRWSNEIGDVHDECGGHWERLWTVSPQVAPGTHPSERVVVYESASENKIQYPARNDQPIPDRLKSRGYERRELNVRDLAQFEKKHNVMNERRHFNKGNY